MILVYCIAMIKDCGCKASLTDSHAIAGIDPLQKTSVSFTAGYIA